MPGMSETLKNKVGPLPTWAWAGLATAGLGGYLLVRKKQSVAAANAAAAANANSSNLGTVPISNLSTAAEPMPISVGPTFVNVNPTPTNTNPGANGTPPPSTTSAQNRAAYDNALTAYRTASAAKANTATLQALMSQVLATQSVYAGTAGTSKSRAAYDNALTAYRTAVAAKKPLATLAALYQSVVFTQSTYSGKAVAPSQLRPVP